MGAAKRRRANPCEPGQESTERAGGGGDPGVSPAHHNVVVTELVVMEVSTRERISQALTFVNGERAKVNKPPLTRASFIGYTLVTRSLAEFEAALAQKEQSERLIVTPDQVRRAAQRPPALYAPA